MMTKLFSPSRRGVAAVALVVSVGLGIAGCATPATPGGAPPQKFAAHGEVLGQGTVLQIADAPAQFCLGAVAESYPPQCTGPELIGWDWSTIDGSETSGDVTWGAYAVQGTWDGDRFTVTSPPIMLALYDPMRIEDPFHDPANAGTTSEGRLNAIQTEVDADPAFDLLTSGAQNGYLFVSVVFDDGDIQAHLDDTYGKDVVQVRSALVALTTEG